MKKSILILLIISLAFVSLGIGCNNQQAISPPPKQEADIKVKRFTNESAAPDLPKKTVEKARLEVQDTVKKYFETAFLDLQLARSADYLPQVFSFYSASVPSSKGFDWALLALGDIRKQLDTIDSNDLEVPILTVNFNEAKKPTISAVQLDFKANYKNNIVEPVKVKVFGWFALQKEGNDWKIFDFWVQQNVE